VNWVFVWVSEWVLDITSNSGKRLLFLCNFEGKRIVLFMCNFGQKKIVLLFGNFGQKDCFVFVQFWGKIVVL